MALSFKLVNLKFYFIFLVTKSICYFEGTCCKSLLWLFSRNRMKIDEVHLVTCGVRQIRWNRSPKEMLMVELYTCFHGWLLWLNLHWKPSGCSAIRLKLYLTLSKSCFFSFSCILMINSTFLFVNCLILTLLSPLYWSWQLISCSQHSSHINWKEVSTESLIWQQILLTRFFIQFFSDCSLCPQHWNVRRCTVTRLFEREPASKSLSLNKENGVLGIWKCTLEMKWRHIGQIGC